MAEYTWKQWENEQNEANNIHADDCYRWQAGIELAGGTWDGEWVDLDKTGKGLVTIDQFNALESQIQSKVSSYTPKNYDPSSTVQIVPGVDGWNKVEDGILKAVCEPDGINRNLLWSTKEMVVETAKIQRVNESWTYDGLDSDGFGVWCGEGTGARSVLRIFSTVNAANDPWAGKSLAISFDCKSDAFSTAGSATFRPRFLLLASNTGTSFTELETIPISPSQSINANDWTRVSIVYEHPGFEQDWSAYSIWYYALSMRLGESASEGEHAWVRKVKVELADSVSDWSPAPEDYGYPSATALSASPQSVEDSDEVAAPEAEEIE